MTPLVWANFPAAALFVAGIAGMLLWSTFKHTRAPDHSEAHAYLRAKDAFERRDAPAASGMTTARQHAAAGRPAVPGRRHATGTATQRGHARRGDQRTRQRTGASA